MHATQTATQSSVIQQNISSKETDIPQAYKLTFAQIIHWNSESAECQPSFIIMLLPFRVAQGPTTNWPCRSVKKLPIKKDRKKTFRGNGEEEGVKDKGRNTCKLFLVLMMQRRPFDPPEHYCHSRRSLVLFKSGLLHQFAWCILLMQFFLESL